MKKFSISVLLMVGSFAFAQNTYIDVTTTLALKLYSDNLENQQEKTLEQQTKLQQAQTWVSTQMTVANNIQNKVLKGLNEVSGTLKNGVQVVSIYNELDRCLQYSSDILELTRDKPQYSVFGVKATQKAYEQVIKLTTDVTDLLKPGELNLATAGDRYKLLFSVSQNVIMLKIWLLATKLNIERAIRLGWFQSINPFQGYINTDRSIVENIMWTYKNRF
ncbi:hypothetical protein [Chryseobacterium koreense]|uniref:Uncharacterized protein n=1 Tax=Chryseobacterium koreense CCUG 49689 TaxID=1304281 RepID=A0A0J7LTJ3_9FLAO|nr:hypothetical protein [Chryseobacterium koreense]KMQ72245.1 hypothetical protein ACM44_01990 [Chryseobacterium koreense CCUG 49689]MBB5334075.1 hypothetical protein [Chryseobacterium koreense]